MICPKCGIKSEEGYDKCKSCNLPLVQEKEFKNEEFNFDKNLDYRIPCKLESSPNDKIIGINSLPNEYFIKNLRNNIFAVFWRLYFWYIVFTSIFILPPVLAPKNFFDILNPLLYLLNVVGLFGYVYKKRIFKQSFWKLSFITILLWLIFMAIEIKFIKLDSLQYVNDISKAIPFYISLFTFIMGLPMFYGLYQYGYNIHFFSEKIEKLKFSLKGISIFIIKIFLSLNLFMLSFYVIGKLSLIFNANIVQKKLPTGKIIDVETNSLFGLKLYEIELNENGFYDGDSRYWHPFTTVLEKEGHWKNGYWDGEWLFYEINGKIKSKNIYKEGKLVECLKVNNGKLKKTETKPDKPKLLNLIYAYMEK